ncbi:serine hydrolase domain-containing protein [Flexithrix dorotheae]|uniref:serine hydrolase domain-containing protein n=1 Tax=Flexithrix dorotheae TaxID=70993 RepID=UPI0003657772|nr:serine hydrolase domain-containing protein [Flexithrix dorotheae]
MRIWHYVFMAIICLGLTNCKEDSRSIDQQLQKELDYIVSSKFDWVPGVSLTVYAPGDSIFWTGVAGVSDVETFSNFSIDQPFRIASVTKTFTATAILRLYEDQKLSLDDPIDKYLSQPHLHLLIQGGYQPSKITIRHCLNHTSGLYNYIFGTEDHPSPFLSMIKAQPQKVWTRTDMIEGAVAWGKPLWEPGKGYNYGDTGYIILGEIIESVTGKNLGNALEEIIGYEALGMNSTWLESVQPQKSQKPLVSCYYKRENFTHFDPSFDLFGGGGLVSTTADLSKFYFHLFNEKVFSKPETLSQMLSPNLQTDELQGYRLGINIYRIYDYIIYGHAGLWDTFVYYSPQHEAAISMRFTDGANYYLLKRVLTLLTLYQKQLN